MAKRIYRIFFLLCLSFFLFTQNAFAQYYETDNKDTYQIRHSIILSNNSNTISRNIYVRIPLMKEEQPVYQELVGERYNMEPLLFYTDADDNRYALFYIPTMLPGSTKEIIIDYYVYNWTLTYDIDTQEVNSSDISDVDAKYLAADENIEVDSVEIQQYAAKFKENGASSFYSLAKKVFADVNLYMTYGERNDNESGAVAALQTGMGTCCDYAELYVAVLRALGIPARLQTGYFYEPERHEQSVYYNSAEKSIDLAVLAHTWTEFYIPEVGWIIADPTFTYTVNFLGAEQKLVNWDYFANISDTRRHFYFYDASTIADISYEYSGGTLDIAFSGKLYLDVEFAPFKDIEGNWAENDIKYLYSKNLISGTGEFYFEPDKEVTRAELAVMLYRITDIDYQIYNQFTDVSADAWYAPYIGAVANEGLMVGNEDLFRPDDFMTRAEMAVVLCRFLGAKEQIIGKIPFGDIADSHWAAGAVSVLYDKGLIVGTGNNLFSPDDYVTRAEMAALFSRVLQYKLNIEL